ncbi:MAG: hypothetical protein U0R64_05250 [Candidatus Nanopelagicales bacterium]
MEKRTATRTLTAAAVVVGLGATGLVGTPASAGGPDTWSTVDDTGIVNTIRPGLQRQGSSLRVVWTRSGTPPTLWARTVTAAGALQPTSSIISAAQKWSTLAHDPVPLGTSTALAGIRDVPGKRWLGYGFLASAGGSITGTLSNSDYAYEGDHDATSIDGKVVFAWSHDGAVKIHRGLTTGFDHTVTNGGCCTYFPAIKRGSAAHTAWIAWWSNSNTQTERGWQVRPVSNLDKFTPTFGTRRSAPGTLTGGDSVSPSQRAALARRPGGDVWLAYPLGYPSPRTVRVWHVGTGDFRDVPTGSPINHVGLSADGSGRLWLSYARSDGRVGVARSRPDVSRFGSANVRAVPGGTAYSTAISAQSGRADVVVNTGSQIRHTQFLPALSAVAKVGKKKKHATKLKVTITDAGTALSGATVAVKKVGSKTTNAKGVAAFSVPMPRKKVAITVTAPGYDGAKLKKRLR